MSESSERIRVGFIGTSGWMEFSHLPIFQSDPRTEMVAICGRNRKRAQEVADEYAINHVFTNYKEMIDNAKLDAIVIGAPDDKHYDMTMYALDARLHVICEKPLALNSDHAKAMYEKAEAQQVTHMTFYTWRWMPHIRYMRELIDEGVLGNIYHCQFNFLMGFGRKSEYKWRFDQTRANGVVGDSGSHMFDLARYLVGDIQRVNAHLHTFMKRASLTSQPLEPANDSAMTMLEFTNGTQGVVQLSALARVDDPVLEQQISLHGEDASVVADFGLGAGSMLRMARDDEPFQTLAIPERFLHGIDSEQPFMSQLVSMFSHQPIGARLFVDAILEKKTVAPSFYEGWRTQQVIDAAIASHKSGQWIPI